VLHSASIMNPWGAVVATLAPATVRRGDHFFYFGMALFAAVVVFTGFAPTFYLKMYYSNRPLTPLVLIHGIAFSSWIVFLLARTSLVAAHRTDLHHRIGIAGGFLATFMPVIGVAVAIAAARRSVGTPAEAHELGFLTIPFGDMAVFAMLVGCGFYWRHRPETHKRLMLLATIALLDAAIARLPLALVRTYREPAFFALTDLVLLACIVYDIISRRRMHPVYLWGGLLFLVTQPLRLFVGRTDMWITFAGWLVR
jgi:hypothetical protein